MKKTTQQPNPYFDKRMEQIGIDPASPPTFETIFAENYLKPADEQKISEKPYFEPMEKTGSIRINYPELALKKAQHYTTEAERFSSREFYRVRQHPDQPGHKYNSPKGSGVKLFFTPGVRESFEAGAEIETLIVVEGEFKAWAIWHYYRIPAVGLGGITAFREKGAEQPHPDFIELFKKCKVKNLILLHDADATAPDWAKWKAEDGHDLGKRLNLFFQSVLSFYELFAPFVTEVYYSRINEPFNNRGLKGIDDLISHHYQDQNAFEAICSELNQHEAGGMFLTTLNMSKNARGAKLRSEIFMLPTRNTAPDQFYMKYSDIIDNREFIFLRGRYVWNDVESKLQMQQHPEADAFIRLGCDYFKKIYRKDPNKNVTETKLEPWKSTIISQDYVKEKGLKEFFSWIPKYDAAINIPINDPRKYQQSIEVTGEDGKSSICYNLYSRISHAPASGDWPTIERYLKHLFVESETVTAIEDIGTEKAGEILQINRYQMALDYLEILWLEPTQKMPIVALVSEEQHTGKSTFLDFLCDIFEDNATMIGNQEITDRFNDDYATKLCICLDEGLIEKKATLEKIKAWSTSDKISIDTKNVSRQRVSFFGKIFLTSNRERNFLPIDQNDSRFWITKVRTFQGPEDPDIRKKMKKEIPAFIHFLTNRAHFYPRVSRHWFSYNLLESEAKNNLKGGSKEWIQSEFEAWIKEQFLDVYQWPELFFSIKEITAALNGPDSSVKFRKSALNDLLHHTFKLEAKNSSYQMPNPIINGTRVNERASEPTTTVKGRKYIFQAEQFLTPEELAEIRTTSPEPAAPPAAPEPAAPPAPAAPPTIPFEDIDSEAIDPTDITDL